MTAKFTHIAVMLFVLCGLASSALAQTPFQKLTRKFENGQVFHANFTHQYKNSYTGEESQKSGTIWIAEKEYKIESSDQRVAVDGQLSRVYDNKRNRVIISTYEPEEDDFAPSRILNGIDSTYTVETQKKQGSGYFIQLHSDDPFATFRQVQITLNGEGIPVKIFAKDPADNLITTTFAGGVFMKRVPAMFELSYPDDAQIIDMR